MSLFGQTKNTTSLRMSGSPSTRFDVNYNGNPMLSQTPGDVLATGASHPGWVSQGNYISAPVAATGTNGSTVGPGNSLSDLFNTYWWVFAAAAVLILFLLFVK